MAVTRMIIKKVNHWLRYLCGWFFILTSSIFLTVHAVWLYRIMLSTTTILHDVNLNRQTMLKNYYQLLQYLDFPWVERLHMNNFTDSEGALKHFADVKNLLLLNNVVLIITAIVTAWGLWRMYRESRLWQLIIPMRIALPVAPVIGVIMSLNFESFFITFHKLLFRNDDWLFDPNQDAIINALPASFFLACFALFFVLIETWIIVGLLVGQHSLRHGLVLKH
ncbi:TIGR01906 family membrane protein [Furfurilactobacillus rossiae]|uniref:Integral membrane protein n=2 Tax=Furfurilactobacillus rossiae TaxID=231049 RepID=A0A0R1RBK5_9LACO|nr:integral membrane protein [Furfurilactobacillus rossiae DSM 15814]QFR66284.1 TIGR01906 family membrane protein [Furfurilactobacillus rossiae]